VNNQTLPELSVILVTPDRYETIRETIRYLRAQTVKDKLEIVIVAPSLHGLDMNESELNEFLSFRVVESGSVKLFTKAKAAGIHEARGPVIAFIEDHSFPDKSWAEALIKAHRQPWAAVGPVIRNANPGSLMSWINLSIEYGPWLDPTEAGTVDHLPGHNSSYKHVHLLDYGSELEAMLEAESILHWDLRSKGHQLRLEPAAKTYHLNVSSIVPSIKLRFNVGRLFGSTRSRNWSFLRRFLYVAGAPLIPLVRLFRLWRELHRPGRPQQLMPRILPMLAAALIIDGFGEMVGYALGMGKSGQQISEMESHRYRHLNKRDKKVLQSPIDLDPNRMAK
jgi:hypothetical protein